MAFGKGTESVSTGDSNFALYTGIAPVSIVAVNPTPEELSAIYGRTVEKITDYTSKNEEGIDTLRIDFILKVSETFAKKELGIEEPIFSKLSIFLSGNVMANKENTKFKVINNYGKTQWVTQEIFKAGGYPVLNDGTEMTNYLLPYKPCVKGEEELVEFLRCFIAIESPTYQENDVWKVRPEEELANCQCYFTVEEIKTFLKGNVKLIKDLVSTVSNNEVAVLFTVKISDENKKYQQVFNRFFAKAKDRGYKNRFVDYINKNAQAVQGLEYTIPFMRYVEKPDEVIAPAVPTQQMPW